MNAFLAIVADTWRQSKQQVVFIIMLVLLLIIVVGVTVITTTVTAVEFDNLSTTLEDHELIEEFEKFGTIKDSDINSRFTRRNRRSQPAEEDGSDNDNAPVEKPTRKVSGWFVFDSAEDAKKAVTALATREDFTKNDKFRISVEEDLSFIWLDGPVHFFRNYWDQAYIGAEIKAKGERTSPFSQEGQQKFQDRMDALEASRDRKSETTPLQRSVESLFDWSLSFIYTISMLLFIAACAGYFPELLAAGAVDVVLSSPNSRLQIFVAKYLGGLALFAIAVTFMVTLLYLGVGIKTGVWVQRVFLALPLLIFSAAVIYSLLSAFGIMTRSVAMAMIMGLIFYVVVDSVISFGLSMLTMGALEEIEWLKAILEVLYYGFPNFGILKETSVTAVMTKPYWDWAPVAVGGAWLLLGLLIGFWRFRSKDY